MSHGRDRWQGQYGKSIAILCTQGQLVWELIFRDKKKRCTERTESHLLVHEAENLVTEIETNCQLKCQYEIPRKEIYPTWQKQVRSRCRSFKGSLFMQTMSKYCRSFKYLMSQNLVSDAPVENHLPPLQPLELLWIYYSTREMRMFLSEDFCSLMIFKKPEFLRHISQNYYN